MNDVATPLADVRQFLHGLAGRSVFFDALHGNHGDRLLELAARCLLQRSGLATVASPGQADFILVNGGGAMAEGWFGLDRLAEYSRKYPRVPLAVLPSSFLLETRRLAELCGDRQAPLYLWARERPSLAVLRGERLAGEIHLGLDHDLAFHLADFPLMAELRRRQTPQHTLVVERDDWEGATGRKRPLAPAGLDFIPAEWRAQVRRRLLGGWRRRQDERSGFALAARRFIAARHPQSAGLPACAEDIALAECRSFEGFLQQVAGAAVIVTTRLHVAILGHLLHLPTYLVDGRYHKFRGVFEYSMQGGSSRLLTWTGSRLDAAD